MLRVVVYDCVVCFGLTASLGLREVRVGAGRLEHVGRHAPLRFQRTVVTSS